MNKALRQYLESIGLRAEADDAAAWEFYNGLADAQREIAMALRGAAQPPATPPAAPPATPPADPDRQPANPPANPPAAALDEAAIRAAERARVEAIEANGRRVGATPELIRQAIEENWDQARANEQFLQVLRDRPPAVGHGPAVHIRHGDDDATVEALQGACLLRAGLALDNPLFARAANPEIAESTGLPVWLGRAQGDRWPDEQGRDIALRAQDEAHRFAGLSLVDICRHACRLDGVAAPHNRQNAIRTAVSGATLSNIFTTTIGAVLLASYEASPDTTMDWCRSFDAPNFKTNDRVLMGKGSDMVEVARGDEAQHTTASDSKESYKLARYARQFVVDERDLIDDSFGALMDMPSILGEKARQVRPDLVYALLFANAALDADSVALFHTATHGNLRTGAALAKPTLQTAINDLGTQTQDGTPLNLFAQYLIVPKTLVWEARNLTQSATLIGVPASNALVGERNPLEEERLVIISDSRLDNGVTDPASGTVHSGATGDWFLAAQNGRHTIEVGYLEGTGRSPQLRSFTLDRGRWGVGWDINLDIAAKPLDFRGLHKSEA